METNFKEEYKELRSKIIDKLTSLITNSNIVSKHIVGVPCIQINDVLDFEELVLWDGRLTLLDNYGHSFSLFSATIEELIDIVEQN